jgi:hypothetical protein
MINPNQQNMKKASFIMILSAFIIMGVTGCDDWVQNRIPADYYKDAATTSATSPATPADTQTVAPPPQDQGAQPPQENSSGGADTQNTAGTGGSAQEGSGGASNPPQEDTGSHQQDPSKVTFDLPQGWYWIDETHQIAQKGDPNNIKHFGLAEGKIEISYLKDGTDTDAKAQIQALHQQHLAECQNAGSACEGQPYYREMDVGGQKVYVAVSQPEYASIRTTYAMLAKNGKIIELMMYADLDDQKPLFEQAVSTLKW